MSRVGLGGGQVGFFGFLIRFLVSVLLVWVLTVILAAVILMFLKIQVDLIGGLFQPARLLEHDVPLGLASLLLGWLLSMLIVYNVVWKGALS